MTAARHGTTIRLRLEGVQLHWLGDSVHERDPKLMVWLKRDVSDTLHTIDLPRGVRDEPTALDIGTLEFAPVLNGRKSLLERAKHADINFAIFVTMRNKNQETCLNQSGDARVPYYEVVGERGGRRANEWKLCFPSWGDPNNHLANTDPSVVNEKGTLYFVSASVSMTLPDGTVVPRLSAREIETHERVQAFRDSLLFDYMLATVRFFGEREYSQHNISDINAYVFAGHCGLLPACSYLGTRPSGSGPGFFERCARTVFQRHNLRPETFDWRRDSRAGGLLSRVLTLPANMMVYVPDMVFFRSSRDPRMFVPKPLESFDSAFARGGGDCEDLALAVVITGLELLAAAALDPRNRLLNDMAWVRRQYVQGMVLGGVTSAEINGDYGAQEMGAHMWTCMIKRSRFVRLWRNGNLFGREEGRAAGMRASDHADLAWARRAGLPDPDEPDPVPHLPDVLIGEGTGFLVPEGTDPKHEEQRRQEAMWYSVFNSSARYSWRAMRQWFTYSRCGTPKSKFYSTATLFQTADFLQTPDEPHNRRFIEFCFCNRDARGTVGIKFADLVLLDPERVAIWNAPPLNKVEAACVRDSLLNLIPLPRLEVPKDDTADGAESADTVPRSIVPAQHELIGHRGVVQPHHRADMLQQQRLVARLVREVGHGVNHTLHAGAHFSMGGGGPGEPTRIPDVLPIEMFLKGKLDEARVQHLIEDCNLLGVRRVECVAENVSTTLSAYRFVFHCPWLDREALKELAKRVSNGRKPLAKQEEFNDYGE